MARQCGDRRLQFARRLFQHANIVSHLPIARALGIRLPALCANSTFQVEISAACGDLHLSTALDLLAVITAVVSIDEAERRGWPVEFRGAWLTVSVHSSLEAVGLTAALANVLAARGIACNVLAGYFHDHLVVPLDRADEAIAALEALAD